MEERHTHYPVPRIVKVRKVSKGDRENVEIGELTIMMVLYLLKLWTCILDGYSAESMRQI